MGTQYLNYEIKYDIELILVKSYTKGIVFLVANTLKDRYHKYFPKASKGVSP